MTDVLMLLSKPPDNDPRVDKERRSLERAGYSVAIHSMPRPSDRFVRARIVMWWLRYRNLGEPHFVHAHDLDTLPLGVALKRRHRCTLILDLHDIPAHGGFILRRLITYADAVIVATEGLQRYVSQLGIQSSAVHNYCTPELSAYVPPPRNEPMVLSYIGGLWPIYDILSMLELALHAPYIRLQVAGLGPEAELVRSYERLEPGQVSYLGEIPMSSILQTALGSDVMMCLIDPSTENSRIGFPNKLADAMQAGRPVITTKGTKAAQIVRHEQMGLAIDHERPGDFGALLEAVKYLRDRPSERERMGRNALRAGITRYNWTHEEKELLAVYHEVTG